MAQQADSHPRTSRRRDQRRHLAGTNLSTIPKVFIECANMRDPADAALVTSPTWQTKAAQAIATTGLTHFLATR